MTAGTTKITDTVPTGRVITVALSKSTIVIHSTNLGDLTQRSTVISSLSEIATTGKRTNVEPVLTIETLLATTIAKICSTHLTREETGIKAIRRGTTTGGEKYKAHRRVATK